MSRSIVAQEVVEAHGGGDECGVAAALTVLGSRWAMLVVRELLLGPKRFRNLRDGLQGISAVMLTKRLDELIDAGVILKSKLPPPASVEVYELTDWGYETETIILSMGRWAARSPVGRPTAPLSAVALMLSLRTLFDDDRADGVAVTIGFAIGLDTFVASVLDGTLDVRRAPISDIETVLIGRPPAIASVLTGGTLLRAALDTGCLEMQGSIQAAEVFARLFPKPAIHRNVAAIAPAVC